MMLGMTTHVNGRKSNSSSRLITAHLLGGLAGGAILGVGLAALQQVGASFLPRIVWVISAVGICGVGLAADLRLITLPSRHRQVPATWTRRLGRTRAFLGYGLVLGIGGATYVPYALMYSVFAAALLTGSLVRTFEVGLTFGICRAMSVVVGSRWLERASALFYRDYSKRWLARSLSVATTAGIAVGIAVGAITAAGA